MALTVVEVRAALGLPDDASGIATATRLFNVSEALITRYAVGAPDDVHDEALLRVAGYLHADDPAFKTLRSVKVPDALEVEPRAPGSALRLSGGMALLAPYRTRRAGGLA